MYIWTLTFSSASPAARATSGRLLIGLLLVLAVGAFASEQEVEFPGPVERSTFGAPLSAVSVPWNDGVTDYLVVGDDIGFANIYYHFSNNSLFQLLSRLQLGTGRIVSLAPWSTGPAGERSLVAASANPDQIIFLVIGTQAPFISIQQIVDLPEDPQRMVFLEPGDSGEDRLAVSLAGIDALAILQEEEGTWSLRHQLPAGDRPVGMATMDRDGDGRRELLVANTGPLSGSLGVYGLDGDEAYTLEANWPLAGQVAEVLAGNFDENGEDEFVVSYGATSRLDCYSAVDGQPVLRQSLDLSFIPDRLEQFVLHNGHPAIATSNRALGLVELLEYGDGQWTSLEVQYAGCQPLAVAAGDLNGDGYPELNCLDADSEAFTILLGNNGPGYWGYPARPLFTTPLGFVTGDFDGDLDTDLVLSGIQPSRLVFFPRELEGGLLGSARPHDLDFFPGSLCAADFLGDVAHELGIVDQFRGGLALLDLSGPGEPQERAFLNLAALPQRLTTEDVDGDGHQDLVAILTSSFRLHVYFGDGTGGFSDPLEVELPLGLFDARALDLDGDGWMELLATDGQNRLWVLANETGRTFDAPRAMQAGSGARYLDLADLDGDQDLDVVVGNTSGESLSMFENQANGALIRRVGELSLGDQPRAVLARDMNVDGLADILVTLGGGEAQRLFLGRGAWEYENVATLETTPGIQRAFVEDFNYDGRPDIFNVDSDLQLGVILRNTSLVFVPVEAPLLWARCEGARWEIRIEVPEPADWVLYATDGRQRRELARPEQAALGQLVRQDGQWGLTLEPARWWADPSRLNLELVQGDLIQRLEAPGDCAGTALPRLFWQTEPWPNPFNPRIEARIRLADASLTRVTVHDVAGRRVATLLEGQLLAGTHPVTWDGRGSGREAAAGVYFLRVETEQGILSSKIVLLK